MMTPERLQEIRDDDASYIAVKGLSKDRRELLAEIERLTLELAEEQRLRQVETGYANRTAKAEAYNARLRKALSDLLTALNTELGVGITAAMEIGHNLLAAMREEKS